MNKSYLHDHDEDAYWNVSGECHFSKRNENKLIQGEFISAMRQKNFPAESCLLWAARSPFCGANGPSSTQLPSGNLT
jgi:hypothetical protein